jgi:hypothetical protein
MLNTWKAVAISLVLVVSINGLLLYGYIPRAAGSYTTLMSDYTTFMLLVAINIVVSCFTLLGVRKAVRLHESRVAYSPESQQRPVAEQDTGRQQDTHDFQRDPLLAKQDPLLQQKIREFQQEILQARQSEGPQQERDTVFQREQDAPLQQRMYELEQEVVHLQQQHRHLAEELKKALETRHEAEQERDKIIEGLESLQQVLQKRNSSPN